MYLTDATILSEEGSREVLEELARPPEDTPERRRTFAGARYMAELWKRQAASGRANDTGEPPQTGE
ncbi:hypothetical protein [Longimicrobium sp.]|uniref:hypothetical protein n=1 Tax=Longimicrobium sp. TaxID=2029185 RepID=UPI003B3AD098